MPARNGLTDSSLGLFLRVLATAKQIRELVGDMPRLSQGSGKL